jgi:membrane protease YdiL (CAAX protease family)
MIPLMFWTTLVGLPIIWWLFTARDKEDVFSWIGLKRVRAKKSLVYLTIACVLLNYLSPKYLTPLFMPEGITAQSQYAGMGLTALPSILFFGLIETGFREEFFFRGFLLKRLQAKLGFWKANIIQALLFALPHSVLLIIISPTLWFPAIMATLLAAPMAMLFGYISEKSSGGSIIPVILIHGLGNVAVALMEAFGR